ncbi:hypothetical protein DYI95_007600 [Thermaerobacter sp. PB12/4term]|uniref:PH domain-containing protein n=1 Tax=Thermaerobacter sp. PB12/4term TaxID=2293838 RepID=UPI000E32C382|nr:PH domain-containing protein [Thermaerobacter sp. PB12/4term]QIA27415.1 hypothetical protein DYI95_007600 [Thermaerobacter sp. PB12/4term]
MTSPPRRPAPSQPPAWRALPLIPARDEGLWTALILLLFGLAAWGTRVPWLFAFGPALVFLGYLARARLAYLAGPDRLLIQTLLRRRVIPYAAIQRAEYLELAGGIRLLATYAPGYAVGWFYLSGLGRQLLLGSTDRGPAVRLHLHRGAVIVTPQDPVEALALLEERGVPLDAPRWVLKEVRRRRKGGRG